MMCNEGYFRTLLGIKLCKNLNKKGDLCEKKNCHFDNLPTFLGLYLWATVPWYCCPTAPCTVSSSPPAGSSGPRPRTPPPPWCAPSCSPDVPPERWTPSPPRCSPPHRAHFCASSQTCPPGYRNVLLQQCCQHPRSLLARSLSHLSKDNQHCETGATNKWVLIPWEEEISPKYQNSITSLSLPHPYFPFLP